MWRKDDNDREEDEHEENEEVRDISAPADISKYSVTSGYTQTKVEQLTYTAGFGSYGILGSPFIQIIYFFKTKPVECSSPQSLH